VGTPIPSIDEWNAALGAGGGFDYNVWHGSNSSLAIRVAQVDYIYSNYTQVYRFTSPQWNSVRLSAGLVFGLGNYYTPALSATCSVQPTEVTEGEAAVTVTATRDQFQSKAHGSLMPWTASSGGKFDVTNKQSARIDTTGRDGRQLQPRALPSAIPRLREAPSATCSGKSSRVKAKPMNPPAGAACIGELRPTVKSR